MANMPTARHGHKLVWFENRIWAIGGNDGGAINQVESFDPVSQILGKRKHHLKQLEIGQLLWVANGEIFVGGGSSGSASFLSSIEFIILKLSNGQIVWKLS